MEICRKVSVSGGLLLIVFGAGFLAGRAAPVAAQAKNRVFELRIATTASRQSLDTLLSRFHKGEPKVWDRVGIRPIGFWTPVDSPKSEHTLVSLVAYESREQAAAAWTTFRTDAEWKAILQATGDPGSISLETMFLSPLDFSPMK